MSSFYGSAGGRAASLARRRALSAGKAALPPATERVSSGRRRPTTAGTPGVAEAEYANGSVTGFRTYTSAGVTGNGRGAMLSVSGTPHIAPENTNGVRGVVPKVGLARTVGGSIVSGTLVRSNVRVTGDEAGARTRITGESDQRLEDDLTPRGNGAYAGGRVQFGRRAVSYEPAGSRERLTSRASEATPGGLPLTGSATSHSVRVTGDEAGLCGRVTGARYLAPSQHAPRPEPDAYAEEPGADETAPRITGTGRGRRITGSFAVGDHIVTGALEFGGPARPRNVEDKRTRAPLTGEGSAAGRQITGSAYTDNPRVTGTGAWIAPERNPNRNGSKPHGFAGAARFKASASVEEPKHLVTGTFGYSSDTSARVTLSGGAQG